MKLEVVPTQIHTSIRFEWDLIVKPSKNSKYSIKIIKIFPYIISIVTLWWHGLIKLFQSSVGFEIIMNGLDDVEWN